MLLNSTETVEIMESLEVVQNAFCTMKSPWAHTKGLKCYSLNLEWPLQIHVWSTWSPACGTIWKTMSPFRRQSLEGRSHWKVVLWGLHPLLTLICFVPGSQSMRVLTHAPTPRTPHAFLAITDDDFYRKGVKTNPFLPKVASVRCFGHWNTKVLTNIDTLTNAAKSRHRQIYINTYIRICMCILSRKVKVCI